MKHKDYVKGSTGYFTACLVGMSAFSVGLSLFRMAYVGTTSLWFLIWNLFLAWLPLAFAWALYKRTKTHGLVWSKINFAWFMAWILFLPNAFYIITDYIHLQGDSLNLLMLDIVLLTSYTVTGIILGITSLVLVHKRALQRFGTYGHWLPVIALLASGFAIYLGRYLRWNSWDVVLNPFGLLYDVSDRFINPANHSVTFAVTILFFAFLGLLYITAWRAIELVRATKPAE